MVVRRALECELVAVWVRLAVGHARRENAGPFPGPKFHGLKFHHVGNGAETVKRTRETITIHVT